MRQKITKLCIFIGCPFRLACVCILSLIGETCVPNNHMHNSRHGFIVLKFTITVWIYMRVVYCEFMIFWEMNQYLVFGHVSNKNAFGGKYMWKTKKIKNIISR